MLAAPTETTHKAKRGRKAKVQDVVSVTPTTSAVETTTLVRRGRKPKMETNAIVETPARRGRKPKAEVPVMETKRGRKPMNTQVIPNLFGEVNEPTATAVPTRRGRKPKAQDAKIAPAMEATPARRGRKPKAENTTNAEMVATPARRGRKAKVQDVVATAPANEPKKRGRKPKAEATATPTMQAAAPAKRGRKPKAVVNELYLDPNTTKQEDDEDVEVLRTRDYDLFKLSEENRSVDIRHVQSLVNSIREKNLLSSYPIIVNSNYEIMDGQHRYQAAQMLGKSVYYRIDDNFEPEHIARINTVSKKWALDAYLKHYVAKGNKDYEEINRFVTTNGVNIYSAIGLLSGRTAQPNNELITKFKNGEFTVKDYEYAVKVVSVRDDFSKFSDDFYKSKTFLNTVSRLIKSKSPEYNHAKMMKKISEQPRAFKKCNTVDQYLQMLTEIINYRAQTKVDFTKIQVED